MEANELQQYMQATTFGKADKQQRENSCYVFKGILDGKLTWEFPSIKRTITVDPEKASLANRARCMVFGLKQRVQDGGAVNRSDKSGAVKSGADFVEEKYTEMKRVADHLESGSDQWAIVDRAAPTNVNASYVTKALVALGTYQGRDVSDSEKANAFVIAVSKVEKLGLKGEVGKAREWLEKNSKVIAEKIRELRAAEAAIDADTALAELMPTEEGDGSHADDESESEPDPEAELRIANAIEIYNAGAATLDEAAEEAGMAVEDFAKAVEEAKDAA